MLSVIIYVMCIYVALCCCASRFPENHESNFDALKSTITEGDDLDVFKKQFEAIPHQEQKAFQQDVFNSVNDNYGNIQNKNILKYFVDYWYRYQSSSPLEPAYARETYRLLHESHIKLRGRGPDYLHNMVTYKETSLLRLYIDAKMEVNALNRDGETALLLAVKDANVEYVDLLLNAGADITLCDNNEKSPLMYAVETQNGVLVNRLCQRLPITGIVFAFAHAIDNNIEPITRQVVHGIHTTVMRHVTKALLQDDTPSVSVPQNVVEELVHKHTFSSSKNDWQREAPFDKDYDVKLDEDSEKWWKRLNAWKDMLQTLYRGEPVTIVWNNDWNILIRTISELYHLVTHCKRPPAPIPMLKTLCKKSSEVEMMKLIITLGKEAKDVLGNIRIVKPLGVVRSNIRAYELNSAEIITKWKKTGLRC